MLDQESIFKEVIVKIQANGGFEISNSFAKYNDLYDRTGVVWLLKEKADNPKMEKAEKINKEILTDMMGGVGVNFSLPVVICETYDIKPGSYLRLSIKEVIG